MTSINNDLNNFSDIINGYLNAKTATTTTETTDSSDSKKLTNTSLKRYLDSTSADKVDEKKIFEKLSIDMGGDGNSITKDHLDSYVKSIKDGTTNVSKEESDALKELQKNWSDIVDDENSDSITFYDVNASGNTDILTSMVSEAKDDGSADLRKDAADATIKAYSTVVNAALNFSADGNKGSSAKSLLQTLLTGTTDENDDANADMIDKLTNIIAELQKTSTVETEA